MSRTYRRATMEFEKFEGEFIDSYWRKKSYYKKGSCAYKYAQISWRDEYYYGASWFKKDVCVTDHKKYSFVSSDVKRNCRRIDRARYKQALLRNEDANITPSFDPWGWD